MNRRWIAVATVAIAALFACSPAHAQRGRRGQTMTPFGAMPSGMSIDQYNAIQQQRQMMLMQQQQLKMQQQWMKQVEAQKKQEQAKKGKEKKGSKGSSDKDGDKGKEAVEAAVKSPTTLQDRLIRDREKNIDARARLGLLKESQVEPKK